MPLTDFLPWLRSERRNNLNNPQTPLSAPEDWLYDALGAGQSATGVRINPDTALEISAVWAACRLVSSTIATLPLPVFRETDGAKERTKDHPVHNLLNRRPNPELSAFVFRELLAGHVLLFGNAYVEIERNGRGEPVALWPLHPAAVSIHRLDDRKVYVVRVDGIEIPIPAENILHVQGFSVDGILGLSPVFKARDTLGMAKASEAFGAAFYRNGAVPLSVITAPGNVTPDQKREISESFNREHQGLSRAQRVAILSGGMTASPLGISPEHAQLIESRAFSISEVARVFGVPPHMIGDLSRSTYSNIEHQGHEFTKYAIEPLCKRIEQEMTYKLLTDGSYVEHVLEGLLRGDSAARASFYREMTNIGAMTINEIRRLEGLNPIEGGDVPRVPLNMAPLGAEQEAPDGV
jgi:HK97 family phage portal protein